MATTHVAPKTFSDTYDTTVEDMLVHAQQQYLSATHLDSYDRIKAIVQADRMINSLLRQRAAARRKALAMFKELNITVE